MSACSAGAPLPIEPPHESHDELCAAADNAANDGGQAWHCPTTVPGLQLACLQMALQVCFRSNQAICCVVHDVLPLTAVLRCRLCCAGPTLRREGVRDIA